MVCGFRKIYCTILVGDMKQNYPLPDAYLIELGRLVALSAQLEQQLNILIGKLAGFDELSDPTAFIMINHSSIPQKLDVLSTLCEERLKDFPHLYSYKDIVGSVKGAMALRNKFTHGSIGYADDGVSCVMMSASARGKLKVNIVPVEPNEIRSASKSIQKAIVDLMNLVLNTNYPCVDLF